MDRQEEGEAQRERETCWRDSDDKTGIHRWDLKSNMQILPSGAYTFASNPCSWKDFRTDQMKSNASFYRWENWVPERHRSAIHGADSILFLRMEYDDPLKSSINPQVEGNNISGSLGNWSPHNDDSFCQACTILSHSAVLEALLCSTQEYGHSFTM